MTQQSKYEVPDGLDGRHHVVSFSSGCGSAAAGKRVAEVFGPENVTLLFADVNGEDPDNYRFLQEARQWVGSSLVTLGNEGRTIWDVFEDTRFLGNSRVDPCSRVLKREPLREWVTTNYTPDEVCVHVGFDLTEEHRMDRPRKGWDPYRVEYPMMWEPYLWKDQAIDWLRGAGIEPPALTREGYPHANCGGACIKAGQKQFRKLLLERPETFKLWEEQEEQIRRFLDKDVSILRDRRKGATTPVLTLRAFRERFVRTGECEDEWGSCHCMDWGDEEPVQVQLPGFEG
tara:strand:+ start:1425 stop:2285 length:861 start_codon:yes stop_codon:yes gene_type:complete